MTRIVIAIGGLAVLLQAAPAAAQERWAIEFRGSGLVSTQDVDRQMQKNGFGFEGAVHYRFLPHLAAYAGWDWTRFKAADGLAGPETHLEETGYAAGLHFEHPFRAASRTAGWLRAGGMYNHLELEDREGERVADSGHGLGWEVGAGVSVDVGSGWRLTPGLRYRSLSRDLEIASITTPVELQYVAFEFGIARRF